MYIDMLANRFDICQYVRMRSSTAQDTTEATQACCTPLFTNAFDEDAATEVASILKSLADPVRLRLVSIIGTAPDGEACACDLSALVDRSQPTVSHHLTQLVKSGILLREKRGKWAWFRVNGERLNVVCQALSTGGR